MCLPVGEFVHAPVTIVDGFTHALLKLNESWLPYVPVWHALNVITVVRGCNLPQTATDWTRLQLLLCLLRQRHTPTSTIAPGGDAGDAASGGLSSRVGFYIHNHV